MKKTLYPAKEPVSINFLELFIMSSIVAIIFAVIGLTFRYYVYVGSVI